MPDIDIKNIRARSWLFLTPEVAATVGLRLDQLQQFAIGNYAPAPEQLDCLARRMGLR